MKKAAAAILTGAAALAAATSIAAASPAKTTATAQKNIVQTAVAAGQFKTLVSLVKQAGLAGALSGKGPLTVFAPTDAAFAKVPKLTAHRPHDRAAVLVLPRASLLRGCSNESVEEGVPVIRDLGAWWK